MQKNFFLNIFFIKIKTFFHVKYFSRNFFWEYVITLLFESDPGEKVEDSNLFCNQKKTKYDKIISEYNLQKNPLFRGKNKKKRKKVKKK